MKIKKYFILFLFIFANVFLFAQPFNGLGDGTESNPYQIWTKLDWQEFTDSVSNALWLNSTWYQNKHLRLMDDIGIITEYLNRTSLSPGWYLHCGGKKINVEIMCNSKNYYRALFFYIGHDTIDSLIIDGIVNQDCGCAAICDNVGIGTISHCINNAKIPFGHAGIASRNGGFIIHCINNSNITGGYEVAGIAGGNSRIIENCINNGNITGVTRIGGIAGGNSRIIENCTNKGKITASGGNDSSCVGGIVGWTGGENIEISNCINLGNVVGENKVGGIIGLLREGWFNASSNISITNCINYGYIKGWNGVGGILGNLHGDSFTDISNCVNTGVVEGDTDVGSIVGKEY